MKLVCEKPAWRSRQFDRVGSASVATALVVGLVMFSPTAFARPGRAARERPCAEARHVPSAFDLPVARERFAWSSPLGQRNDLYAAKGTSDGRQIWAVGAMGTILSLRGADATLEESGTDAALYDLWVVAENDIWIVGERGTILHGDGKRWSAVRSGTKHALFSIGGRSARDLWIGGGDGPVLHRKGNRWRLVPVPTKGPITTVTDCAGRAVCALTLASSLPHIDRTNRPCRDPEGDCPQDEPMEPEGDRILRWSNGRWSATHFFGGYQVGRAVSTRAGFWATTEGQLWVSRAGGDEGQLVVLPKDTGMIWPLGLWAGSEDDGWVVGERCTQSGPSSSFQCDSGAIWRFDGRSASLRFEAPAAPLLAVWAWSKTGAIAVGKFGTVMRFDGDYWTAVSKSVTDSDLPGRTAVAAPAVAPPMPGLSATDRTACTWAADANSVWVAATSGENVKVARWDGKAWSPTVSFGLGLPRRFFSSDTWDVSYLWPMTASESRQVALWGTSASDVWLAGRNGIVLRFDGKRWQRVATPTRTPLSGLDGTQEHVVAVGAQGTRLELHRQPPARPAAK
jgi:hypothetical protein